jgi:hypothetical protein
MYYDSACIFWAFLHSVLQEPGESVIYFGQRGSIFVAISGATTNTLESIKTERLTSSILFLIVAIDFLGYV